MKLLVLSINYWPEVTGIAPVITSRCEYLASAGHEVMVCTAMPYYPEWRVFRGYRGRLWRSEMRNGVKIHRSWLWVPQKITSKKRIVFEASFLVSSFVRALGSARPDLLLVTSPPLGLAFSAQLLSRAWSVPYIFDVQDLQPDAAADLGMLPDWTLPPLYRAEAMAYRNAALVTTLTEGMARKIAAKGIPACKLAVVPIATDLLLTEVGRDISGEDFCRAHGLTNKFIVLHSGNMGVKQGLDTVLEAAQVLQHRQEIVFVLCGQGSREEQLKVKASALKLNNVRFLPVQAQPEFLKMLAVTHVSLVSQESTVSDILFPSKTVTSLTAARPVIAAVNEDSEVARVVRSSSAGMVVEPGHPRALAEAIMALVNNPELRRKMGEHGRSYALAHWHPSKVLSDFEKRLFSVVPRHTAECALGTLPVSNE